ncbi:MAG: hypothetical protein ACD_21C00127G0001 [uncultured bacterium]|nr:MAG: hypothetical protein ACD_21C00127G0001 [uncultured bacterium]
MKTNEARRKRENLATENMTDSYIRKLMKADGQLKGVDIPQVMIDLKRAHLRIKRQLQKMKRVKA